jgi:hypothetical protein
MHFEDVVDPLDYPGFTCSVIILREQGTKEDIIDWCIANEIYDVHAITCTHFLDDAGYRTWQVLFQNNHDAALFKLKWQK